MESRNDERKENETWRADVEIRKEMRHGEQDGVRKEQETRRAEVK